MTATVHTLRPHRCRYVLRVRNRSICVSECHYGEVIDHIYRDGAA